MKKLLVFLFAAVALTTACRKDDFLEPKTSALTEDTVFADSTRTMAFLARIYGDVGFSFIKTRWSTHGNTEVATDDAEYMYSGSTQYAVVLYNGTESPLNFPFTDFWQTPWDNIRRCNLLLSKLPTTPLSKRLQARMAAEARFLRVWYYENLLLCFGGVPLISDQVYDIDDYINLPRAPYADCLSYLTQELDAIAAQLPEANGYAAADYGRITRGACLALKSRLLLEAASPLFNGGAETQDGELARLVSYPTYDAGRWQQAADAAQAVINTGAYSLGMDNTTAPGYGFYSVFLQRVNPEYIFFVNRPANRDLEFYYNPPTRGGASYSTPTQNIVDAFPMKNGKPITDATSGYDAKNPYLNRDPRFYYTIIYNTALYYQVSAGALAPVYTYEGGTSDAYVKENSSSGYYCRKMCDVNIAYNSSFTTGRGWPLLRYAEVLLTYAEAINEAGQPALAYPKLVELRRRAGLDAGLEGLYGMKGGMSQAEMRDFIRNERRIELAYEDHRWHDIRRWKIAMTTNNATNNRMRIVRSGSGTILSPYTYAYNVTSSLRRHNFRPEMYLLPIPDAEIRKVPLLRQNPGW